MPHYDVPPYSPSFTRCNVALSQTVERDQGGGAVMLPPGSLDLALLGRWRQLCSARLASSPCNWQALAVAWRSSASARLQSRVLLSLPPFCGFTTSAELSCSRRTDNSCAPRSACTDVDLSLACELPTYSVHRSGAISQVPSLPGSPPGRSAQTACVSKSAREEAISIDQKSGLRPVGTRYCTHRQRGEQPFLYKGHGTVPT